MRRVATAVVALLLSGTVTAEPAHGHQEIPGLRNGIDEIRPPLPTGVTIAVVVSAADQLVAENATSTTLEVLGEGEEPFLRIGPDGAFGNVRSPTFHRSRSPDGDNAVPADATADAEPVWVLLSRDPSWGWFDHRLHRVAVTRPPGGAAAGERVDSWTIPIRYGDLDVVVRGHRAYQRPTGAVRAAVVAAPPGVRAVILDGAVPALSLTATHGTAATVYGADGRPFIRLGPAGAEADVHHPSWRLTAASRGRVPEPGATAPRWEAQGPTATLTWLEERARHQADEVALAGREAHELMRWSVPVEVDGVRGEIAGTVRWVPVAAPSAGEDRRGPPLPALAAGLAGSVGLLVAAGRRRRRG